MDRGSVVAGCCGAKKQKLNASQSCEHHSQLNHESGGGYHQIHHQPRHQHRNHCALYSSSSSPSSGYGTSSSSSSHSCSSLTNGYHENGAMSAIKGPSCCAGAIVPVLSRPVISSSLVAHPEMGFYCFDVLHFHLHRSDPPRNPNFPNEPFPLFVTWRIGKDMKLRGCMGTFDSVHLHPGLREYAITSAFKDSRFPPVKKDEIPELHVSVSILLHFEDGEDFLDWEIGVHGIRIEFLNEKGSRRTATYLPDVAPAQGWDRHQTIDSLLRKGGFKGNVTDEVRKSIRLTRYQSEKISVSFTDYASVSACIAKVYGLR